MLYKKTLIVLVLGLFFAHGAAVDGSEICVSPGGNDLQSGFAGAPVRTIQVGIQRAQQNGLSEVRVEEGFYAPGQGLNLAGSGVLIQNSGIVLSGGWQSGFQTRSGRSVLVGQGLLTHIVTAWGVREIGLEGFTLMDGRADGAMCSPDAAGGGMLWVGVTNSWVRDCTITECWARDAGGGMAVYFSEANQIEVELFSNFCTNGFGGGLYLALSRNNELDVSAANNWGLYGGGVCLLRGFQNDVRVDLQYNHAFSGGGLFGQSEQGATLVGRVLGNRATFVGGGVWLDKTTNTWLDGEFCLNVARNYGTYPCGRDGAGICLSLDEGTTVHGLLQGNSAQYWGGALFSYGSSNLFITAEITGNNAISGGALYLSGTKGVTVESCLVEGNVAISASAIYLSTGFGPCHVRNCTIINNDSLAPPTPGSVIKMARPTGCGVPVLENNVIGGSPRLFRGFPYMTALEEGSAVVGFPDLVGHVMVDNVFLVQKLEWFYSDFTNGKTRTMRAVNHAPYSGAASTSGNTGI